MIAAKTHTPAAARNFLNTIRAMLQFGVDINLISANPAVGVKRVKIKTSGYRTWTEEDIAAFEAKHPIGSRARLAFALLLFTAQRRSDVVRMGRQHIRDGVLQVRQQKTGMPLGIPIHPHLQAVLAETPSEHLTFLTTQGALRSQQRALRTGFARFVTKRACPKDYQPMDFARLPVVV
jgi:integrase